jgi:hypothetical protein
MFFDEGRDLNQPQYRESEACKRINLTGHPPQEVISHSAENHRARFSSLPPSAPAPAKSAGMVDAANNKLQELMQLLYLLSRDPAVPKDARYHVTMAQSEIALLARLMRNNAEGEVAEER